MDNTKKFSQLLDAYGAQHANRTASQNQEIEQQIEENKRLRGILKDICEKNAKLRSEISIRKNEREYAARCYKFQEEANKQNSKDLKELKKQVTEHEALQARLEREFAEVRAERAKIREKLEKEQNDADEKMRKAYTSFKNYEKEMKTTETLFKNQSSILQCKIKSKSKELSKKQQEFKKMSQECNTLTAEVNKVKAETVALNSSRNRKEQLAQKTLVELDKQLVIETSAISELNTKVVDLTNANAALEQNVKGLQGKVLKKVEQRDTVLAENKKLAEALDELTKKSKNLEKLEADLIIENEVDSKTIDDLQKQVDGLESEIRDIDVEIFRDVLNASQIRSSSHSSGNVTPSALGDIVSTDSSTSGSPSPPGKNGVGDGDSYEEEPTQPSERKPLYPKRSDSSKDRAEMEKNFDEDTFNRLYEG